MAEIKGKDRGLLWKGTQAVCLRRLAFLCLDCHEICEAAEK